MAEPHPSPAPAPTPSPRRFPQQSKKTPTIVIVLAFILVAGLGYVAGAINTGTLWGSIGKLTGQTDLDLASVQDTYHALKKNFDGDLDEKKLIEGANRGMVEAAGDEYTVFMNNQESSDFDNSLTGNIGGGIGVELSLRNGVPTVVRILQDNPAEKAGVTVGDIITAVNGETTKGASLDSVTSKIRGEVGTSVKLTINRSGEEKEFSITRDQVNNPSAYGEVKDGVGILTITRFDNNTASLARVVANDFKKQGVKGVVVDLRGNGGGYVTAAQGVAGIWLDKQLVASERRSGRVTEELKSTGTPILAGVPTTVLVNESSASASEIVAGALHDHKVATLVGTTTFGKGSVQKLIDLDAGALLKVTIARWYTPGGLNISEKGITPEQKVTRSVEDINAGKDPQLDAAIKTVR